MRLANKSPASPAKILVMCAIAIAGFTLGGCPSGGGAGNGSPAWPKASSLQTTALPGTVSWTGVYFINTPGSRGTMHLMTGGDNRVHGCWLAEDKHARATFTGTEKDNLVMLDWTEQRIGFAGAPTRMTAYLILTPDNETGTNTIKGEYGADLSNDSGSAWEGILLKNQDPKEDGCKIEEGESMPVETKPLE
jgi:hypothetical protein